MSRMSAAVHRSSVASGYTTCARPNERSKLCARPAVLVEQEPEVRRGRCVVVMVDSMRLTPGNTNRVADALRKLATGLTGEEADS